jgi:hypothetical protein
MEKISDELKKWKWADAKTNKSPHSGEEEIQ